MILEPTKTFKIRSQSDKNIIYDVRFFKDGSADCSCPFFWHRGYRRGLGQCKHIDYLREKYFNKSEKLIK